MPFPTNPPQPGHAGGHAATPRILIRIQVQHVAMQRVGNPPSRTQIHVASLGRIALQRAQPRVGDTGQRVQLEQRQPATLTPFTQSHGRSHHVLISLSVRRATTRADGGPGARRISIHALREESDCTDGQHVSHCGTSILRTSSRVAGFEVKTRYSNHSTKK